MSEETEAHTCLNPTLPKCKRYWLGVHSWTFNILLRHILLILFITLLTGIPYFLCLNLGSVLDHTQVKFNLSAGWKWRCFINMTNQKLQIKFNPSAYCGTSCIFLTIPNFFYNFHTIFRRFPACNEKVMTLTHLISIVCTFHILSLHLVIFTMKLTIFQHALWLLDGEHKGILSILWFFHKRKTSLYSQTHNSS